MSKPIDPLKPSASVLIKLGSAVVHADEMNGYHFDQRCREWTFDKAALLGVINDPEVKEWIAAMTKLAFMPVKRS